MNANPSNETTPHYDSYSDFYKFFEESSVPEDHIEIKTFPPTEPLKRSDVERNKTKS